LQIRYVHDQTRIGEDDQQAVINAVLPGHTAPNLMAASELALAQAPGAAVVATTDAPTGPKTIEEVLQYKTNMSFAQKSLEFALADVGTDVTEELKPPFPFEVKIIGADLEKDGLTRNQQVRNVSLRDSTVADILTAIVVTAMSTGKPPTDPAQKMIWVVAPHPDKPSQKAVLVTTRKAAEANGYTVPKVFTAE